MLKSRQPVRSVAHLPELPSASYRNRVRKLSPGNRNHGVQHLPDSHSNDPLMSSSGTRATSRFRYLGDIADGGVLAAGAALGVGERAELAGAVVADRVDPDDLAVLGQLN